MLLFGFGDNVDEAGFEAFSGVWTRFSAESG